MSDTTTLSPATNQVGELRTRIALGAVGVLVGVYGAYVLLGLGWDNLLKTFYWLAGGVIIHDGIIGFAMVAVGVAVVVVPHRVRAPIATGLIVIGTVTMTAIPMLGRFGERTDNATLLDRNYTVGWLVFAALVVIGGGLGVLRSVRRGDPDREVYGDTDREPHDEQSLDDTKDAS